MTTPITEWQGQLKKSGQVTLDANGGGVLTFDADNARQRWEVTSVTVTTSQPATASVVPVATLAVNTTTLASMSAGNQRGATSTGNQDTWTGSIDVGPADYFSVIFSAPVGQSGSSMAGYIASAVVTGTKYTRRA